MTRRPALLAAALPAFALLGAALVYAAPTTDPTPAVTGDENPAMTTPAAWPTHMAPPQDMAAMGMTTINRALIGVR